MNWQNIYSTLKSDYVKLLLIMALAFYLAFILHHNYPYPVHIDEWMHLVYSKAILHAGDTVYIEPFCGESIVGLRGSHLPLIGPHLGAGYHLFWGIFHQISGIPWLTIFKYFPSLIFVITILSVYILAKREGFGWEATFFACLIPTTVGILGPGFLVPVALGLLFIPLSIFVVFNFRTRWAYLVLFIFTCFLLSMHAVSAVILAIILTPYVLLNLKGNFKHSLGIMLALAVPFLAPFPWIFNMLLPTAKSLLELQLPLSHVDIPLIFKTYGYLPMLFCVLGTFLLALRAEKRAYSLILGILALLLALVGYFTFHYGVPIVYYRGLMYMMLMVAIVAGAGLAGVKNLKLPPKLSTWLKASFVTENTGRILCLIFIGLTLAMCIPVRLNIPYYHIIDEQDYESFVWIRENTDCTYRKAILDPWKATAFVAIAEKYVYTKIHSYPKPSDQKAYDFLRSGCTDTDFLRENGLSIVYTRWKCNNPDLVEVRENIYLLKEAGEDN